MTISTILTAYLTASILFGALWAGIGWNLQARMSRVEKHEAWRERGIWE